MRAPTNITGPDGTKCRKGEEIPADWFDDLPDLQAHLDAITSSGADVAVVDPVETVAADLTVERSRSAK